MCLYRTLAIAGLWSEWLNPQTKGLLRTFSIVTTEANTLMQHIHNNPKIKAPRMPVMLPKGLEDGWLHPIMDYADKKGIKELIAPLPDGELAAYPVARLRGKEYQGNVEGVSKEVYYAALSVS